MKYLARSFYLFTNAKRILEEMSKENKLCKNNKETIWNETTYTPTRDGMENLKIVPTTLKHYTF